MKAPAAIFSAVLLAGLLCQGCVIYQLPMPEVKGSVVDGVTKKPIAGARIENRYPKKTYSITTSDGCYDLPAYRFRVFSLIPGCYFPRADFSIEASGYQTYTNKFMLGGDGLNAVQLKPIELQRKFGQ